MNEGWICPRCGRVNAPFVTYCECKEEFATNLGSTQCNHEWECDGINTGGSHYRCKKCGSTKTVPYNPDQYGTTIAKN